MLPAPDQLPRCPTCQTALTDVPNRAAMSVPGLLWCPNCEIGHMSNTAAKQDDVTWTLYFLKDEHLNPLNDNITEPN